MSELVTVLVVGGLLTGVGYAAWVLSRDSARPGPKEETPYQLGLHALVSGDREEALRAFTESVQLDSDNADAYIHLGNLLRDQGEVERALHLHRELLVRADQTPLQEQTVREALVLDWIALGKPEQAVEEAEGLR